MNGADAIMHTAARAGIDVCFANPGTTELSLVSAMDNVTGIRPVLGLFEGCCTGAADGYGRMAGKPALTLLHLGPGLANGLANLHNARRGRTPLINIIGEHATWHRQADAPLTMDIEALAGTVSGWQRTVARIEDVSTDMADAVLAARQGMVACLIVPHDCQWTRYPGDIRSDVVNSAPPPADRPDIDAIENIARQLNNKAVDSLIIMGGKALSEVGLRAAARIRAGTGCDLMVETFPARMERGRGLPLISRVPYFPGSATKVLSRYKVVVLVGARAPVSFFGYQDQPSSLLSENQRVFDLTPQYLQADISLVHLADALSSNNHGQSNIKDVDPPVMTFKREPLCAHMACAVVAVLQPENAIIVDESISSGGAYFELSALSPRHSLITLTGGSLGQGMPCAVGAAMACPHRAVINLQADGSALYTHQSLWMQARYSLDITTLLFSNRSYEILKLELLRAGGQLKSGATRQLTDLDRPPIDWVRLSEGMGVPAATADTPEGLADAMKKALVQPGPHLIVVNLAT